MTTQVFVASTAFGLATVVAALDDGAFEAVQRRVLVVSNNAVVPETANRIEDVAGLAALCSRFDAVYDYNEAIAPQHPSLWQPRAVDLPLMERYLSARWSLSGDVWLVVESIQVSPALSLCRIFPDARIDVYADGLMSYGPTRSALPNLVGCRIERLLHLDLAAGLVPVLLTEFGVPAQLISSDAFQKTVAALGPPPDLVSSAPAGALAVLLGQYLSAMGILRLDEETGLHLEMVRGAVAAGFSQLIFKPHPSAPPLLAEPLVAEAARLGATLTVHDSPELVETWFRSDGVGCVIGCFSTALMTAATLYDVPVARVGTELLLSRLAPYQNSNRVPVTIIDATLPDVSLRAADQRAGATAAVPVSARDLARLVRAVSFCMQPDRYPQLRQITEELLTEQYADVRQYFNRRRLTLLKLPGGLPTRGRLVRIQRRGRSVARRILGPALTRQLLGVSRRLGRKASARGRSLTSRAHA